jgi:hypothetical protein
VQSLRAAPEMISSAASTMTNRISTKSISQPHQKLDLMCVAHTHTAPKKEGKIAAGFLFLSSLYFLRLRDRDNPADQ